MTPGVHAHCESIPDVYLIAMLPIVVVVVVVVSLCFALQCIALPPCKLSIESRPAKKGEKFSRKNYHYIFLLVWVFLSQIPIYIYIRAILNSNQLGFLTFWVYSVFKI